MKQNVKPIYLGGTGRMYEVIINGNSFLFKPGTDKWGGHLEPFRADVQVVGYNIQNIIDPASAVYCYTDKVKIDGSKIYGALQERIDTKPIDIKLCDESNLRDWQWNDQANISNEIVDKIMREAVTDYLLHNFDSHGNNFIMGKDDILRGIDKEQSMRYINKKDATIDLNFSPNKNYGEAEPISHTILKRYADNVVDFDILAVYNYISKVEKLSDKEYIELFEKYLFSLQQTFYLSNSDINNYKVKILERKNNIRNEFTKIFLDVIEQRSMVDKQNSYTELAENVKRKNR